MDWQMAIEKNREALRRILVMLAAMVGVAGAARPATLPRHLHRFVLRLLRPAESAARRLIIVAARGLVVEVPPRRPTAPKPQSIFVRDGVGTGIVRRGSLRDRTPTTPKSLSLPLFDPLKTFGGRPRYVRPSEAPHIRSFDDIRVPLFRQAPQFNPPPPSPGDLLDASRLHRRLDAIARALDDLPRQAKRLARWQARRDADSARQRDGEAGSIGQTGRPEALASPRQVVGEARARPVPGVSGGTSAGSPGRFRRFSPMRPGRPPGWRRKPGHPVDDVLNDLHGLAVWVLSPPDTS